MASDNQSCFTTVFGCLLVIGLLFAGPPGWAILFIFWLVSLFSNNQNTQSSSSGSSTSSRTLSPNLPDDLDNILIDISSGEIKDPVTQETFRPGEQIYLCLVHRLAYHQDSWQEMGGKCTVCGHGNNAKSYKLPMPINFIKRPRELDPSQLIDFQDLE